jgi:hypothetical protein
MTGTQIQQSDIAVVPVKFKLHSIADLRKLPAPEWLVTGMLETRALGVLYGASMSCKSFVALDLAMSVAAGVQWHGRSVKKGRVAYVIGEGTTGATKRIEAWLQHAGLDDVEGAFFMLEAPQIARQSELMALTACLCDEAHKPSLIVLDTLARCFVGGDENSAQEVGEFVGACRHLQQQLDAAVLIVHHTGKPKNKKNSQALERGSSALRAAANVMIEQRRNGDLIKIINDKQKDDEECKPFALRLKQVVVSTGDGGKPITSCVLVDAENGWEPMSSMGFVNDSEQFALNILATLETASSGDWREAIEEARGGASVSPKTFQNWRGALVDAGYIEDVPERLHHYRLTTAGSAMATGTLSKVA